MGKMARNIIIAALVALYAVFGIPDYFYGDGCWWLRAATYSFFHASWWHLAVNALAIWTIYRFPPRAWRDLIVPYLIAVAVYPLALRPVLGFSNVLYAVLGLRTPPLKNAWWRQPQVLTFLAVTVALVFVPQFSATTHIAAFVVGMIDAAVQRKWRHLTRDCRRYL
jgi:membrane associated rhomboid family serine protease